MLVNFVEITKIKDINYTQLSLDDLDADNSVKYDHLQIHHRSSDKNWPIDND